LQFIKILFFLLDSFPWKRFIKKKSMIA